MPPFKWILNLFKKRKKPKEEKPEIKELSAAIKNIGLACKQINILSKQILKIKKEKGNDEFTDLFLDYKIEKKEILINLIELEKIRDEKFFGDKLENIAKINKIKNNFEKIWKITSKLKGDFQDVCTKKNFGPERYIPEEEGLSASALIPGQIKSVLKNLNKILENLSTK